MGHGKPTGWMVTAARLSAIVAVGALVGAACNGTPTREGREDVGTAQSAVWTDGDFESGTANQVPPAPWALSTFLNPNNTGYTPQNPQTYAGLNLTAGGNPLTVTLSGTNQPDPDMGAGATLRYCRYGTKCARINFHSLTPNNGRNVNQLTQTMTVADGDVDPSDGKVHIRFVVAPVLEDPNHLVNQQPYFFIQLTNVTQGNAVLYSNFNFSNQPGVPWQTLTTTGMNGTTYKYTDWQLIDVAPGSPAINKGDQVQLLLLAAGCALGGHEGYLYVDGLGTTIPGLSVSGTGPAQVNPGGNITYTINYKNGNTPTTCTTAAQCTNGAACVGGACVESGVTIDFTPPPNTTVVSYTAPAGATCVPPPPALGDTGKITCTFTSPVAAGASGSFTVTVAVNSGTSGSIVFGNYDIFSTQETTVLGNKITTLITCTQDSDCSSGTWCNETVGTCTPTVPNGQALPTDPAHTNPTLNGVCTAQAGALTCTAGACDTDNLCGLKNGDGPCTPATGATVCRSGVCDTDNLCGFATGDGPCTMGTGPTVCRSGACTAGNVCAAPAGCNVDADCTGGNWCLETTHTCTAKLANGTALPTDPPHTSPTLNGMCTAAAATLVCASGVCDTSDSKCGYANGDGPCTATNGGTVCRSGACSVNGTCEPAGGCNVDGDCTGGKWCLETTHTCTAKLTNGTALPNDPTHTSPTLNGTCTPAAATLVCASGVCETTDNKCGYVNGDGPCTDGKLCRSAACDMNDNKCGYATGDGPCNLVSGPTVCRSGACSITMVCEPAGGCDVDADCAATAFCQESTHTCTPKLANGTAIPNDPPHTAPTLNGTCTPAAATLVCASAVCDTADNKCGYATGDGPCTVATGPTVCRSGACSVNGTCEPTGGCNVDGDCMAGNWCQESTHMCTPKLTNGTAMPTDAPHTNPTLDGTCTAPAALVVCASGVCDTADNKCGYANGDGPCTVATGGTVCRSTACSVDGTCEPLGGCNVDGDCTGGKWCNEGAHMCLAKLANGAGLPTDAPHTNPTLNGTCTPAAATLVCASGVCDTKDNACGYANGDGPCTSATGDTVCRSGTCSTNGACEPAGGCNVDADCAGGTWCDESMNTCVPTLANGTGVPTDPPHTSPTLDGTCTPAAGALTCTSGVCDTKDNACGYANGDGPCSESSGATVCRSGICASTGANQNLCVACTTDANCPSTAPTCNAANKCIQCTDSSMCSGSEPICDTTTNLCVPCNGDQGSGASDACGSATEPFCFFAGPNGGTCGKCAADADCQGHTGNLCNTTTGLCVTGCKADSDCPSTQWCDAATGGIGMCTDKLGNGTMLPSMPAEVATCSDAVGKRVCQSGVCDPKDNTCGFADGDGPCANAGQCRDDFCDAATQICRQPTKPACVVDDDCPTGDYCTSAGTCVVKVKQGGACTANNQCQNATCIDKVCSSIIGSGNGLVCAARDPGAAGGAGPGAGLVTLALAAMGVSWRRGRRSRRTRPDTKQPPQPTRSPR